MQPRPAPPGKGEPVGRPKRHAPATGEGYGYDQKPIKLLKFQASLAIPSISNCLPITAEPGKLLAIFIYFYSPMTIEVLAKLPIDNNCHSERSEESRIFKRLRSFTSSRMTEKPVLQEALLVRFFQL
jgi:hypothetical protein